MTMSSAPVMTVTLRAGAAIAAAGIVLGMLSACSPEPEPTPTKTALFASEEEAFAAAEETYRAYNDAGNSHRKGDKGAKPDDYLIGTALEAAIDGRTELRDAGLSLAGDVQVADFLPVEDSYQDNGAQLSAVVCLDLSGTRVLLEDGTEAVLPARPTTVAQLVQMIWVDGVYLVSEEQEGDASSCAA
ncbi:hypothetical protein [Microbacterium alcoholitolerans]|uniref:hypothetical protein n=1 Tax=unclassified Microbacterium TaxID=2609290 RepID=UPI003D16DBBC